jgi:hypothetical protein
MRTYGNENHTKFRTISVEDSDKMTYDIVAPPAGASGLHKFIQRTSSKPRVAEVNQISADILNCYTKQKLTVTKYKKLGRLKLSWSDQQGNNETTVSLNEITAFVMDNRTFDPKAFGLPAFPNNWLDGTVALAKPDGPIVSTDGTRYLPFDLPAHFCPDSPVVPCLDREGLIFSSFQHAIFKNIVRLHLKVVDECDSAFDLSEPNWIHDLRFLINECVTAIDMTLNQLYLRAKFSTKLPPGWHFDEKTAGPRHGVRMMEKFCWIFQITGNHLEYAGKEKDSFRFLKDLRNHINHFDPPCFCCAMEEVADWLNKISDIGRLLLKIRAAMGVHINPGIIEIITLPCVHFVPKHQGVGRLPIRPDIGYGSSTWAVYGETVCEN